MHILDAKKAQIESSLNILFAAVSGAIAQSVLCLTRLDFAACDALIKADAMINDQRKMIEQDCLVAIASQQPVAHDLRDIVAAGHIASELERLGDYASDIAATVKRMDGAGLDQLSLDNILVMSRLSQDMLDLVMRSNQNNDAALARQITQLDDRMDALLKQTIDLVLAVMRNKPELVNNGSCVLWIAHYLERCGDRATNIAEQVVFRLENEEADLG